MGVLVRAFVRFSVCVCAYVLTFVRTRALAYGCGVHVNT